MMLFLCSATITSVTLTNELFLCLITAFIETEKAKGMLGSDTN